MFQVFLKGMVALGLLAFVAYVCQYAWELLRIKLKKKETKDPTPVSELEARKQSAIAARQSELLAKVQFLIIKSVQSHIPVVRILPPSQRTALGRGQQDRG